MVDLRSGHTTTHNKIHHHASATRHTHGNKTHTIHHKEKEKEEDQAEKVRSHDDIKKSNTNEEKRFISHSHSHTSTSTSNIAAASSTILHTIPTLTASSSSSSTHQHTHPPSHPNAVKPYDPTHHEYKQYDTLAHNNHTSSSSTTTTTHSHPTHHNNTSIHYPLDDENTRYLRFLDWLKAGGAYFKHLELRRYTSEYRGVHIRVNQRSHKSSNDHHEPKLSIPKGKVLLRIPHSMLITVELAKSTPIGQMISELTNIGTQALLAVYLLEERAKGISSQWYPWLCVLPQSFRTLPQYFNEHEYQLLNNCDDLLAKIEAHQKINYNEYHAITGIPNIRSYINFTYEEFCIACLQVGTRVFSLNINNQKTSVLAPLADMCNHSNQSGTNWTWDHSKQSFTLTACTTLYDGDQVYESYGVKCNKRFFASYGFCLPDNIHNEVSINLTLYHRNDAYSSSNTSSSASTPSSSTSSSSSPSRPSSTSSNPYSQRTLFTVHGVYDSMAEEMFTHLRVQLATIQQLQAFQSQHCMQNHQNHHQIYVSPVNASSSSSPYHQTAHPPLIYPCHHCTSPLTTLSKTGLSVDNELNVLYTIRHFCKEHLLRYDTTLEDDMRTLSMPQMNDDHNVNIKNCLIFRSGEKKIYHYWLDVTTIAINLLTSTYEVAKAKIQRLCELNNIPSDLHISTSTSNDMHMTTSSDDVHAYASSSPPHTNVNNQHLIDDEFHEFLCNNKKSFPGLMKYLLDIIYPLIQQHHINGTRRRRQMEVQRLELELDRVKELNGKYQHEASEGESGTPSCRSALSITSSKSVQLPLTRRQVSNPASHAYTSNPPQYQTFPMNISSDGAYLELADDDDGDVGEEDPLDINGCMNHNNYNTVHASDGTSGTLTGDSALFSSASLKQTFTLPSTAMHHSPATRYISPHTISPPLQPLASKAELHQKTTTHPHTHPSNPSSNHSTHKSLSSAHHHETDYHFSQDVSSVAKSPSGFRYSPPYSTATTGTQNPSRLPVITTNLACHRTHQLPHVTSPNLTSQELKQYTQALKGSVVKPSHHHHHHNNPPSPNTSSTLSLGASIGRSILFMESHKQQQQIHKQQLQNQTHNQHQTKRSYHVASLPPPGAGVKHDNDTNKLESTTTIDLENSICPTTDSDSSTSSSVSTT